MSQYTIEDIFDEREARQRREQMKAKDTRILRDEITFCSKDMNAQAEISFKAGMNEVVEWLQNNQLNKIVGIPGYFVSLLQMQAFLKEKGVE